MGSLLWLASGGVAFAVANFIPHARPLRRWVEVAVALPVAMLLGMTATALDFGGWQEPDPRAVAFAFAGTLAVLGLARLVRVVTPRA